MNNTLVKGLALLEVLAHSPEPQGVSELARRLGVGKSGVHRLLQGLLASGYVKQTGSCYQASIRLYEMGTAVLSNLDLRRAAEPVMQRLSESTRESVHLSVLDGAEVVYVHKIDSMEPVRAYSQIGGRAPAHCVATGKALLACLDDAQLARRATELTAATPRTVVEPARFLREMSLIRRRGFAVNRGEWREGVSGIGAAIRARRGQGWAAIGISGPSERLRQHRIAAFAPVVVEAARLVEIELGVPPTLGILR